MTTQEIANFIKSQIKLGSSKEEVEKILTINHITPGDISAAFAITALEGVSETPKPAPATVPPGLTGIKTIADQEFPPPPAALDSIDAAKQVQPPPPPAFVPPPPPRPASQLNVPIIPTMSSVPVPHHSHAGRWLLFLLILIILGTGAYAYVAKPAWATPILDLIQMTIAKYTTTPEPVATTPTSTAVIVIDPTANWQTYRNDKYGFEFKYPLENISKIEGSTNETFQMINTSGQSIKFDIDSLPAEELAGEVIFDQGGITIKKLCTVCEGPGPETAFDYNVIDQTTSKKAHFLYLGYSRPSVAEFEQILSTFKFIEPVATSTVSTTTPTSSSGLRGTSTASQPPEVNLPSLFLHP